jgi:BirA family biotin operon repressor/biotin-[acetyl-CoA-carboxylase] ligase
VLNPEQEVSVVKYAFEIIGSTQTWSKEHPENIPKNGWMAVIAKKQTGGKVTNGRTWHSPEGNIYVTFSKRLQEPLTAEQQLRMKQVASLAVVQTLEKFGLKPQLKWSNDVLLNRKKISGVLDEIQDDILTIGIGLNVNMSQEEAVKVNEVCKGDPNKIPATSLLIEEGHPFGIDAIFNDLQQNFYINMELLLKGKFDDFVKKVEDRLTCKIGEEVTVQRAQEPEEQIKSEYKGRFVGLNKYGSVIIDVPGKSIIVIDDGRMILNSPDHKENTQQPKEENVKGDL